MQKNQEDKDQAVQIDEDCKWNNQCCIELQTFKRYMKTLYFLFIILFFL
ncbi:unnamed protein product [Paramecium sonneborni]|uniref:Uncharacterized protein n=1 Tax=Paramecium sonneborni TaxID=65129 RepID=A0A8S1KW89_9CILI|nr:unnamed protein product [Paramecium sonneborni]